MLIILQESMLFIFTKPTTLGFTLSIFKIALFLNVTTTIVVVLFSTVYFYVMYRLLRNRQPFQLLLSIVLHAYFALLFSLLLIHMFSWIITSFTGEPFDVRGFSNLSTLLFFVYLGLGLKWGLGGTNRQFLIAFISYIVVAIIMALMIIVIYVLLLASLFNMVSDLFCETIGVFLGCS
jgi:uncharacterized membrane protein YhfC